MADRIPVGGTLADFVADPEGNTKPNAVIEVRDANGQAITDLQPGTDTYTYDGQPFPSGKARTDRYGYYGFTVPAGAGVVQLRTAAHGNTPAGPWVTVPDNTTLAIAVSVTEAKAYTDTQRGQIEQQATSLFAPAKVDGRVPARSLNGATPDATTGALRVPAHGATFTRVTGKFNGTPYDLVRVHVPRGVQPVDVVQRVIADDYDKTYTGGVFAPPRRPLSWFHQRTHAPLVTNANAWTGGTNELRGFQINNGRLLTPTGAVVGPLGRDVLCLLRDGTMRIYQDPFAAMADGAVHSTSHGPALVVDGVGRDVTADLDAWPGDDGRSLNPALILGQAADGDFLICSVAGPSHYSTGMAVPGLVNLAVSLGFHVALMGDGGGSRQVLTQGEWLAPSTDATPRAVPDALAFYAVPASAPGMDTGWVPLKLSTGFSGTASVRRIGKDIRFAGLVHKDAGLFTGTAETVGQLPAPIFRPDGAVDVLHRFPLPGYGSGTSNALMLQVRSTNDDVQVSAVGGGSADAHLTSVRYTAP